MSKFEKLCEDCKYMKPHELFGDEYAKCTRKSRVHNFAQHEMKYTCKGKYWVGSTPELIQAEAEANIPWWRKLFEELMLE